MASNFDDPSSWRLSTTGGIPYKLIGVSGDFDYTEGNVVWSALIESSNLVAFLTEMFPPAIRIGNRLIPQNKGLANLPGLVASRVSFASWDDSLPIDPFIWDSGAPSGTYYPVIKVDVEFGPSERNNDGSDPRTFLEISGNATGEFFHTTAPGAKWEAADTAEEDEEIGITYPPGYEQEEEEEESEPEENRDPTVPILITVPTTSWSMRWNHIPFDYWEQVLIHRVRFLMGKVNSESYGILFDAAPGTLLFDGWNYSQKNTWRDGEVETPPVTLDIKIIEKRVVWKGKIQGHNSVWRPGVGWERLLIDGVNPLYESFDFNILTKT